MDRLFLSKDSFLYDFPPAVALLGKNHDRAVAKLTPYLEDGSLSQRDFDSTLNLVDTVMDERLSRTNRILHYAGFCAVSMLATNKMLSRRRWPFPARAVVNMVPAAAVAELYLVNRVILVDHTRWEGGLANRTRMRGILSELAHLEYGTDTAAQAEQSTAPEAEQPVGRWAELRRKWAASRAKRSSGAQIAAQAAGSEAPAEVVAEPIPALPHEPAALTAEERRFKELVDIRERTSSY